MKSSGRGEVLGNIARTEKLNMAVTLLVLWCVLCSHVAYAASGIKPQDIPDALAKKGQNLSAFKAVMDVSAVHDNGKSRNDIRGFLLYRRPSDFRFQGTMPGGNPLFELVISGTAFEMFVPTDRKVLKGNRKCFVEKFPDIAEMRELIPLALSQWKGVRLKEVVSNDREKIVVKLDFSGTTWNATLTSDRLLVTKLVRVGAKGPELVADFGSFPSDEFGWIPRQFRVHSPAGDWTTTVTVRKLEINPFVVEKNFQLELPFSPKVEQCK
ncbi:MAG: hypothetical protein AB1646_21965 [Thermodesulfobacteriota bacterium]